MIPVHCITVIFYKKIYFFFFSSRTIIGSKIKYLPSPLIYDQKLMTFPLASAVLSKYEHFNSLKYDGEHGEHTC